jgi:hypothetical protein
MKKARNCTKVSVISNWQNRLMKVSILLGFLMMFTFKASYGQTISPYLLGNNYWFNGTAVAYVMQPGGLIDQAGFQTIRIGGFGPNTYTDEQYLEYIRRIKAMGALPIVQVKASLTAQQAIDFIKKVNVTNGLGVKVWSIGNEPDHPNGGSQSDAQISAYTKNIAAALKSVDPTIIVVALEFSEYSASRYANLIGGANSVNGLVPGKDYYYVDVIGFHRYVIKDISELMGSINDLIGKVNTANTSRPAGKKLMWGMGEFNSHYNNDKTTDPDMKVWSFNNGQFHAELYGVGMQKSAFSLDSWSMLEGEVERAGTDLSLFDKNYDGRSTYYHSLMIGQNLKQNYLTSNDNQTTVGIVAMGDASGAAVMIINKNKTTAYDYTIRLDNGALGTSGLQISVNAAINKTNITGNITAVTTQMLVFDSNGNLKKRYTYTKANADNRVGAKIEVFNTVNNPPTVSLTAPANNTNIDVNTAVTVSATAADTDGTVSKVDFYAGTTLIGTDNTAPYSISWTPTIAGTYVITAKVTDNGGASTTSTASNLVVNNVIVYIPIPGKVEAEVYTSMFGIQTEVTTDAGGGLNIGYTEPGDWMDYSVNVQSSGTYTVNFRLASFVATGKIELRNQAGTALATLIQGSTGGWQTWATKSLTANLTAGQQTLRIYYTGAGLNLNWVEFLKSNTPPTVFLTAPVNNTNVDVNTAVTISATASDADGFVTKVDFYAGTTLIGTDNTLPYSISWTPAIGGTYAITAKATDDGSAATISTPANLIVNNVIVYPTLPGKIEAEAYTAMFGIQTQATTDAGGGLNIGYVDAGDWLDYGVNVATTATYSVSFRVASQIATGAFQLKNGANVLATIAVPNTGGWQIWQTVTVNVPLVQGIQTLRIQATGAGLNINWINYAIAVNSIKIEAESYSNMFGIQTEASTDAGGGLNVGWTDIGDWMDYQVTIPAAGLYTVDFRVASLATTGKIELRNQAGTALATLTQGSTGGWQTWATKSVTATLPAGAQTLRIYYAGAGLNINWLEISQGLKSAEEYSEISSEFNVYPNPASEMITIETNSSELNVVEIHSISGALMFSQEITAPYTEFNISELKDGLYLITLRGSSRIFTKKLIIN